MTLTLLAVLVLTGTPSATVTVYAFERVGSGPAFTHTWAVFQRGGAAVCISWLPLSGVRLLRGAERGRNLTHAATLDLARQVGAGVRSWGPIPVSDDCFGRARKRKMDLESGAIGYKTLDRFTRPGAVNCIHACSDVARHLDIGPLCGFAAGRAVARHLRRGP